VMRAIEEEPVWTVSGETLRLRRIGHLPLERIFYASGMALPKHSHPHAYITFVIEGAFGSATPPVPSCAALE